MNKAKKVKVNENGNMIRNCKYESGTEIEPYIYDGKLTIKGVGWQNSGVYFILDGEDGKQYYYSIRERYNDKLMKSEYDVELAALFVFLNKHCFNGLYRVNGKGLFNVPYNNSRRASVEENVIWAVSEYLQNITILQGDFEDACKEAKKGDFVFLDSPYAPLNPTSFEAYTKEGFDIESHKRLAKLSDELTARGCYCMLTNHNTDLINELYGNKGYKIDVVSVRRMINSDASNRVGEEVIICNY